MKYSPLPGVEASQLAGRPLLRTPQGGAVALDARLLEVWQQAGHPTSDPQVQLARACLAEAGLLERMGVPPAPVVDHPPVQGKLVSIILVNYHSQEWLGECLASLRAQNYRPLEVLLVNNSPDDDLQAWLAQQHLPSDPDFSLHLLSLEHSLGYAAAANLGVAAARGAFYLLLNPDVHLAPDAVAHLAAVAAADPQCAAVAAKLKFSWAPAFLNGLGNRVGPFSWGSDIGLGHLDLGQFDELQQVPSVCFAAALIARPAWQKAGPLDAGFPMYYEDSEWSYRARALGYHLCAAPQAVVYHAFGRRVHTGADTDLSPHKLRNVIYGRLRFAFKLAPFPLLLRFLAGYAFEDGMRLVMTLTRGDGDRLRSVIDAYRKLWDDRASIRQARRSLHARQTQPVRAVFSTDLNVPPPLIWRGLPELTWDAIQEHYAALIQSGKTHPMPEFDVQRPRLLMISNDIVDRKMAGPGMRYLEMARALSEAIDVTLAVPGQTSLEIPGVRLLPYRLEQPGKLREVVAQHDVVLFSSFILDKLPFLAETSARRIVDLYDPQVLENLHYYQAQPLNEQTSLNQQTVASMNGLLRVGDFFLCGNERQRDFWLGALAANGRVNPLNFRQDPELRQLIEVVSIGFPSREPQPGATESDALAAIPPDAQIVLWGGGIWDWLDPLTLVEAWPQVLARHPQARLVFLGTRHPNPLVPQHQMAVRTEARAAELGEKDRSIIFIEWLPYVDREALLCEADVGVALHPLHAETRYSIRTRVLDYFWTRLPVLVSDGDVTSEWVRRYGLGRVVPPGDVDATAKALNELLDRSKADWAPAFEPLRQRFSWSQVVAPLKTYCLSGAPAPDRTRSASPTIFEQPQRSLGSQLARARYIWRTAGGRALLHRTWRYIQWRLSR